MTDPNHRKVPSDYPSDELVCSSMKKMNLAQPSALDTNMTENGITPKNSEELVSME